MKEKLSPATSESFAEVERSHGTAWLHMDAPVWVVKYDGVPGSQTHRYDSWQAYRAVERVPAGRDPWTVDNRRIGPESGYASEAEAFSAAKDFIRNSQIKEAA